MSEIAGIFVGIDVSKTCLDIAVRDSNMAWHVGNDDAGIDKLVKHLKQVSPGLIVLEATGDFEMR